MYKVKRGLVPDCVSDLFIRKDSKRTRCGIVTSYYHVLEPYAMANALLIYRAILMVKTYRKSKRFAQFSCCYEKKRKLNLAHSTLRLTTVIAVIFVANRIILIFTNLFCIQGNVGSLKLKLILKFYKDRMSISVAILLVSQLVYLGQTHSIDT